MRDFFVVKERRTRKTQRIRCVLVGLYLCANIILSYRLIYNEFYQEIHGQVEANQMDHKMVYPFGEIVGIYTECKGVFVIDTCEIETIENDFINPAKNILQTGDYILEINGNTLDKKEVLVKAINDCNGDDLELKILRDDKVFNTTITPVLAKNNKYMIGTWIKDDLAGVGTITYYTEDGAFAALGHGMGDGVTNELIEVKGGDIYHSEIVGIKKGKRGEPGEVKGVIYYGLGNHLGELDTNCGEGIYGILDDEERESYKRECEPYEVADKAEIKVGKAQIISSISGRREVYDIQISYVDYLALNSNKGLHIEVTDEKLLELTGGIVQGMSGSPILQDGKLIGAVTHVLVNDPTRGYGIFIEDMIPKTK
ncbi:MAG: SpoIVB peptidase [Agathobacter sp.]|nr:SpoIVB peptidase [Agathobacter sp.]